MGYVKHNGGEVLTTEYVSNGEFAGNLDSWQAGTGWVYSAGKALYNGSPATEMVTNGTFTGSAASWTLGAQWAYSSNHVLHTNGGSNNDSANAISQNIGAVNGNWYLVTVTVIGLTAGQFLFISLGESGSSFSPSADGTYTIPVKCSGSNGTLRIGATANAGSVILDSISVKNMLLAQTMNAIATPPIYISSVILRFTIGGTTGSVALFKSGQFNTPFATVNAGDGAQEIEYTPSFQANYDAIIFKPSATFDGTIDDVSIHGVGLIASLIGTLSSATTAASHILRLKVGGTTGSVTVQIGEGEIFGPFDAGAGNVNETQTLVSGTLEITVIPSHDFNGTIDNVSLKLASGGTELVENGEFNGTTGWD